MAASIMLVISSNAYATDTNDGLYTGFGVASVSAEEQNKSSTELGANALVGYQFSDYISTELSVFNLGDHKELGMKGLGLSLSVKGHYPINDTFNVFAELGGKSVDLDIDEMLSPIDEGGDDTLQDGRDSALFMGVGAQYRFNKRWSFVVKVASVDLDADMQMAFAQIHYRF